MKPRISLTDGETYLEAGMDSNNRWIVSACDEDVVADDALSLDIVLEAGSDGRRVLNSDDSLNQNKQKKVCPDAGNHGNGPIQRKLVTSQSQARCLPTRDQYESCWKLFLHPDSDNPLSNFVRTRRTWTR